MNRASVAVLVPALLACGIGIGVLGFAVVASLNNDPPRYGLAMMAAGALLVIAVVVLACGLWAWSLLPPDRSQ